jgi:transcriptional regulator with XRE-family HTH domain
MEEFGDTIYTLGEYLHLSPSAISKYRNAEMVPKHIAIDKMAERFNINPVWLMGANVDKYPEINKKPNEASFFTPLPYLCARRKTARQNQPYAVRIVAVGCLYGE